MCRVKTFTQEEEKARLEATGDQGLYTEDEGTVLMEAFRR